MMPVVDEIADRLLRPDFERWADQARRVGHCAHPIRIVGSSKTMTADGQVISDYSSREEPDGVVYVRCGNRRSSRCPSCSDEYKSDMWHLLVAGASGGDKGVPASVAEHPLVFLTLTAPSFGAVHGRPGQRCHPRSSARRCEHGRSLACMAKHSGNDPLLGQALCPDCYDYESHIVWQWYAPELWRRFVIRLRRELAMLMGVSEKAARSLVRVQFAKVAEFQRRGIVHFHALVRLDGPPERDELFPAPGGGITAVALAELARVAASRVTVTADPLPWEQEGRRLRWGSQVDARVVGGSDGAGSELTDRMVAAYIAKYATKATEDVFDPAGEVATPHVRRLFAVIGAIGIQSISDDESPYRLLWRWKLMLGFRGHFSTKSRRFSTTLGRLRTARRDWQRKRNIPAVDVGVDELDDSSILVVGEWRFVGMGWLSAGDAALAAEAAAAAREWRSSRTRDRSDSTREER